MDGDFGLVLVFFNINFKNLSVVNTFSASKFNDITWFTLGLVVALTLITRTIALLYINSGLFSSFDVLKGQD